MEDYRKELYEKFSARLLAVCMRYIGDRGEAEDVLHDSFLKIFDKIGRYRLRGEADRYAWMRRVTVNTCIDSLRKRGNGAISLDAGLDLPEELPQDPAQVYGIPPEVVVEMISSLPEGCRTVFNLYCVEGYSHKEIARMTGINEKSSSSQYARARARLSQMIKEYIHENE